MIITDLVGTLTGAVTYRPDDSKCWNDWYSFTRCAKKEDCGPFACAGPITYAMQPRYPIRFAEPPDEFDDIAGRKKSTGYEFQPRVVLTGWCSLKSLRIYCMPETENLGIERMDES
jgi:hypothetical protein